MLREALPKPKPFRLSEFDPLGIAFDCGNDTRVPLKLDLDSISFSDEIAWMKSHLATHPLIGSVVNATSGSQQPQTPQQSTNRASTGRRRSSIGGDRASAIAAQFEVVDAEDSPVDEEMEGDDSYAASSSQDGEYMAGTSSAASDDVSLDIPPVRRM